MLTRDSDRARVLPLTHFPIPTPTHSPHRIPDPQAVEEGEDSDRSSTPSPPVTVVTAALCSLPPHTRAVTPLSPLRYATIRLFEEPGESASCECPRRLGQTKPCNGSMA